MSNTTDLSISEYERLALPAATVIAFVDGALCDTLEPIEIVRGGYPEFGWATLSYNPVAQLSPKLTDAEHLETPFAMGRSVHFVQLHEAESPETALAKLPVFVGRIEGIETQIDGSDETVTILVKDSSAALDRITVYGRHVGQVDGSTLFFSGFDTTFNPAGQANAGADPVGIEGRTYSVFAADDGDAAAWSCAEAIDYLLSAYVPADLFDRPDLNQLRVLTQQQTLRDLDVTGLSLTEALQRCCAAAGLQFRFEPRPAGDGPSEAIIFYRKGQGRRVELNCQNKGETLNLSRTNVAALHSTRDFYPVTHQHIAQGDFKMFEATFDLIQAWDPTLEDTDYASSRLRRTPSSIRSEMSIASGVSTRPGTTRDRLTTRASRTTSPACSRARPTSVAAGASGRP